LKTKIILSVLLTLVCQTTAWAEGNAYAPAFLDKPTSLAIASTLPAPPQGDDPKFLHDQSVFATTRQLQDSPRWTLATSDAALAPTRIAQDFSCAAGFRINQEHTPILLDLIARLESDSFQATDLIKIKWQRSRPLAHNTLPICELRSEHLEHSYSYPSGHSTTGWTVARTLALLMPERQEQLLARGREFGESRIVCGAHWETDVEAGRVLGERLVNRLQTTLIFENELQEVRQEIIQAKDRTPLDATICSQEQSAATSVPNLSNSNIP
jgi:acid phosphatase (class A)